MTTFETNVKFEQIDDAFIIAQYYKRLRIKNYRNENNVGLFLQYIHQEQFDVPQLKIEDELGDYVDPHDCSYVLAWDDIQFPIAPFAITPNC